MPERSKGLDSRSSGRSPQEFKSPCTQNFFNLILCIYITKFNPLLIIFYIINKYFKMSSSQHRNKESYCQTRDKYSQRYDKSDKTHKYEIRDIKRDNRDRGIKFRFILNR